MSEAHERTGIRIAAYCLMPNHWYLLLWPREDGELSEVMRWITVTHTQRWRIGTQPALAPFIKEDSNRFRFKPMNTLLPLPVMLNAMRCGQIWFRARMSGVGRRAPRAKIF